MSATPLPEEMIDRMKHPCFYFLLALWGLIDGHPYAAPGTQDMLREAITKGIVKQGSEDEVLHVVLDFSADASFFARAFVSVRLQRSGKADIRFMVTNTPAWEPEAARKMLSWCGQIMELASTLDRLAKAHSSAASAPSA